MIIELVVPSVGESITEVQIGVWLKAPGDFVQRDEPIVEVESEKATVEIFAPVSGKITEILKKEGETANVGDLIGYLEEAEVPAGETPKEPAPVAVPATVPDDGAEAVEKRVMPAAQRLLAEQDLRADDVPATGPGGRLLKEDVLRHLETAPPSTPAGASPAPMGAREEEVIAMSPMRRRIAEQLVTAQQTAALLTTFNEVDMSAVKALRSRFKDTYQEQFGVRLGFMSFFVKAAIEALKLVPEVNAEVRGTDVVYKNYYDIGIAVGGPKGLVVPILRNAERMSFAEIEAAIGALAAKVRDKKITVDELRGGTFTISNGGIYGSMLSTPIVSPPQSGILGMHAINDRPVVLDGNVVIRPIMYVALTYDHRVVDGQGAVTFLKRIKECIEDPTRILLEI